MSRTYERLLAGRVEAGAVDRLSRYAALLEQWSDAHSLVRFTSPEDLVERHILESVAYQPTETAGLLVDVGSGAGLPGVPLLCTRPDWRGVLVEPRQKRWAFLRRVIRELELDARVERGRYQDYRPDASPTVITARAIGGYGDLLKWAGGVLGPGGRVVLWGTVELAEELAETSGWRVLSSPLSRLERGRIIEIHPCFT
jgi:16S rRNA (guanine527-N7)-methyltransferase